MRNVAVIGANGQLGVDVCHAFRIAGCEVFPLTHSEIEVTSAGSVHSALAPIAPDLIVNTSAMHHVDNCENNPALAFAVNAIGARNIALFANTIGSALAHISTDYVFDGEKLSPYIETDTPLPLNVYGNSKLAAETFVRSIANCHFVVRVSAIYGFAPCRGKQGMNFVERMLYLANNNAPIRVVDDEFVTPTPTEQVAIQLVALCNSRAYGLYHATCEGSCSWFEFARAIFDITGLKPNLDRTRTTSRTDGSGHSVRRPKYSVLENAALKRLRLNRFTDWRIGLEEFLNRRNCIRAAIA
ncbi:MAG TPA: dTDP-4-dehydrorhamnose reductase [Terriglobales bacterium]